MPIDDTPPPPGDPLTVDALVAVLRRVSAHGHGALTVCLAQPDDPPVPVRSVDLVIVGQPAFVLIRT